MEPISDLDPDVVLTYLNDNPEFVDRFVFNHVKQDRIEKWLQTKHGRRHFEETSNGELKTASSTDLAYRQSGSLMS